MDEYGVFVDLNTIDLRHFIWLSDKAAKDRQERIQRQKAGQNTIKPRIKLKTR